MTNEVAILILKQINEILRYDPSWEDNTKLVVDKAFEMAIEALKKQIQESEETTK